MKNKQLVILLGAIAVLGAVFLLLNFHFAVSKTFSEKTLTTIGIGDNMPGAMQRKEKINIALVGEGPLISILQKSLATELKKAGFEDIDLVQGLEPEYPNPVLIVRVSKPGMFWTPFFANSQLPVQVGYVSNGGTAFIGENPGSMDNKDGSALNVYGEYLVRDRSWELISRLGDHQILADYWSNRFPLC